MKPYDYYRSPDRLVAMADARGCFSCALDDQLAAEHCFTEQRLERAKEEVKEKTNIFAKPDAITIAETAQRWRVSAQKLARLCKKSRDV